MPKALPVDHEKIKMVALQIGVREAARRFELSEDMVRQWSKREKWFAQKAEVEEITREYVEECGVSPAVTKTPSEVMEQYKSESKLSLAHVVCKASKGLEAKDDTALTKDTQAISNLTTSWAKLHTSEGQSPSTAIQINLSGMKFATEDQV